MNINKVDPETFYHAIKEVQMTYHCSITEAADRLQALAGAAADLPRRSDLLRSPGFGPGPPSRSPFGQPSLNGESRTESAS